MRKERIAAAQKLANNLFAAEIAIDQALSAISNLQASLPETRLEVHLSAVIGQDVIEDVSSSLASVVAVRGTLVGVHGKLEELKVAAGLREVAIGGGMNKNLRASADNVTAIAG
jgi:uncharacterized protein YutE (UPF0331/DUF86 family)